MLKVLIDRLLMRKTAQRWNDKVTARDVLTRAIGENVKRLLDPDDGSPEWFDRNRERVTSYPSCGRKGGNCQCQQAGECVAEAVPYSRSDAAEDALRTDYIKTGRGVAMMFDAEFVVWRKTQRGVPTPSLDLMDPRRSMDWNAIKDRHLAIYPLAEADRSLTFEEIVAKYPCPAESEF